MFKIVCLQENKISPFYSKSVDNLVKSYETPVCGTVIETILSPAARGLSFCESGPVIFF